MDTINKLLKKPAPKRRTRAEILAAQYAQYAGTPEIGEDGEILERPDPVFVRYVQSREGVRLGVPRDWVDGPVGEVFRREGGGRRMVEEVS